MAGLLTGQRIVVIGSRGAIGGAFLDAAHHDGATCATLDRDGARPGIPAFHADVTSLEQMLAARDLLYRHFGEVDTVVNFAGVHHAPMNFADGDPAESLNAFRRVVDVNLTGAFIVTMVFSTPMISRRHGHILHLCSNASRLALYGSYGYNASKHGLEGIIKTAAAQLIPYGVRVNGVAPGTVESALNRKLLRAADGETPTARAASILAHTPSKRFATLDGICETLVATCIPQRHLTGNVIFCDDGYNIEGHSWPEGNAAVYAGAGAVDNLYRAMQAERPDEP